MSFAKVSVDDQYKKDTNIKKEDVKVLMEWMEKQPHLPKATELQILFILQSCYYSMEMAKNTIDNFFTMRTLWPDLFHTQSEDIIRHTASVTAVNILPGHNPAGEVIYLAKLLDTRTENYIFLNIVQLVDKVGLLHLFKHGIANGNRMIIDMQGSVFGHLSRTSLPVLKKYLYFVTEGLPVRVKGIHLINLSSFVDTLITMLKPLISKQLMDIIHFHSSIDSLYEFVPKEMLPKEYGGRSSPVSVLNEKTVNDILANIELFKWIDTQQIDESKRLEKNTKLGQIFGVEGSFKKLQVD